VITGPVGVRIAFAVGKIRIRSYNKINYATAGCGGGVRASGFRASINSIERIRAMWAEEGVQVASGLVIVLVEWALSSITGVPSEARVRDWRSEGNIYR